MRVRFSPAPTGSLHVGGARTALFNWLFARHHGGEFLLRIEDTDVARSRPEWIAGIQDALGWLGLDWDGEPILQSGRFDRYREAATRLLDQGDAYECFETPEELAELHAQRRAQGLPPGYDGRARDLTPAERRRLRAEGRPVTIRFRTPDEGTSTFHDLIRGEVSVDWSSVADFVIVRADGTPLFFLANAADDLEMGITHVIRGEDLLDSTHRVLALWAALDPRPPPAYAHLPLILGDGGAKLSKRHGAVALEDFRAAGYLPEALLNYLALLGWAPSDDREIVSREELIAEFDLERVTHSAARFDYSKLDWMNGEYLRLLTLRGLVERLEPFVRERYDAVDAPTLEGAARVGHERAVTLGALADQMDFLFVADSDFAIAPDSWERLVATERVAELLDAVIAHVETCAWDVGVIDLRPVVTELGLTPRKVMPALYAAIEGRHAGLPLFDSIALLGRARALARLRAARARLGR